MSQPEGFVVNGHEHKVCKLVKSLYGLKQAPRAWYQKLNEHLLKLNFKHYDLDDATLFVNKVGKTVVYLMVYVDDILMTGNNENYIVSIKKELRKGFEMTDLGYVHYYLGIEVTQHPKSIFLSQKKYIGYLLNRFGMTEFNPLTSPMEQNLKLTSIEGKEFEDATKYRQLVGSLNYLTTTRPDISFAVGILFKFMQKRYSTIEVEYVAAAEATKEIVWLRKILEDLQHFQAYAIGIRIMSVTDSDVQVLSVFNPFWDSRHIYVLFIVSVMDGKYKYEGIKETIRALVLIDKLIESTQALVSTINKLENLLECQRCCFLSFVEDKTLEHNTSTKSSLAKLNVEVRNLVERVVVFKVSNC
eukprot:PITA_04492